MKKVIIYYLIILITSCNTGSSSSNITDSIKDSIAISDAQTSKIDYIKKYLALELDLVYLEITRREKLDSIFLLTKKNSPPKIIEKDSLSVSEERNEIKFLPDREEPKYFKEFEDPPPLDTLKLISTLKRLKNELHQISLDSNSLYNLMSEIILKVPLSEIKAFKTSRNSLLNNTRTSNGCSDQRSYDEGYSLAADQIGHGLMADCEYLYKIASTQKYGLDHYCFCSGVNDWIRQHQR